MPTEHEPWVPNAFTPINGQKIAIVGYSHHREPQHEDRPEFTKWVVQRVISGEQNGDSFFGPVSKYFGYENKANFWYSQDALQAPRTLEPAMNRRAPFFARFCAKGGVHARNARTGPLNSCPTRSPQVPSPKKNITSGLIDPMTLPTETGCQTLVGGRLKDRRQGACPALDHSL